MRSTEAGRLLAVVCNVIARNSACYVLDGCGSRSFVRRHPRHLEWRCVPSSGGKFYKALPRAHADRLVASGDILLRRIDDFGFGLPDALRDASEGRFLTRAENIEIGKLGPGAPLHIKGVQRGGVEEQRLRRLVGDVLFGGVDLDQCGEFMIVNSTISGKADVSEKVVAWCLSLEESESVADDGKYDAIVEIDGDADVWGAVVCRLISVTGLAPVAWFGAAPVIYGGRDATVEEDIADVFPGIVKPAGFANEKEMRWFAWFREKVGLRRFPMRCPELVGRARLFKVKTSDGWIRV